MNPDFDHRVWNDDAIDTFGLHNEALYRRFFAEGIYDGAADVARIEILYRCGGVYVDADSVALRPLQAHRSWAQGSSRSTKGGARVMP